MSTLFEGSVHAHQDRLRIGPALTAVALAVLALSQPATHPFGPNSTQFQQEFAVWNGNRLATTTTSGTAALHMGLVACDISAGDHVLVTAYSWSSSATCIMQHNAIPIFVDIDFD